MERKEVKGKEKVKREKEGRRKRRYGTKAKTEKDGKRRGRKRLRNR